MLIVIYPIFMKTVMNGLFPYKILFNIVWSLAETKEQSGQSLNIVVFGINSCKCIFLSSLPECVSPSIIPSIIII